MVHSRPRDVVDRVRDDPDREAHEKEFAIHAEGDAERCTITATRAGMMRRLLKHPQVDIKYLTVLSEESGARRTVSACSDVSSEEAIITVVGTAPIGLLKIKAEARANNRHHEIVTDQY